MLDAARLRESLQPDCDSPSSALQARQKINQRLNDVEPAHPGQLAGTRWPIGCVSLEVTQRCNLDCSACYLSESAELIQDVPLSLLVARVRLIHQHYGAGCDIQISGGDPTLRPLQDLVEIVREIRKLDMRCSLFTNGIKASRSMLQTLAHAGLNDVAFHVDVTQDRKGYGDETSLNTLRDEYIARAQGLGLNIYFNTTVVESNFHDIQTVVKFFIARAEQVSFASFQMQADTGRGVLRERPSVITQASVMGEIQKALAIPLDFDVLAPGHRACNRYATALVVDGRAYEAFAPIDAVRSFFKASVNWRLERGTIGAVLKGLTSQFLRTPKSWWPGLTWLVTSAWRLRRELPGLISRQTKLKKLSFLVHNFMDAKALDLERTHACVFMTITQEGPISMCAYNAQREHFLKQALRLPATNMSNTNESNTNEFNTNEFNNTESTVGRSNTIPIKFLKGRERSAFLEKRRQKTA